MSTADQDTENTPAKEKRNRQWDPAYNPVYAKNRRERYANDEKYRDKVRRTARDRYDKNNGGRLTEAVETLLENTRNIEQFGQVRKLYVGLAEVDEAFCLTEKEMARLLGRHYQSFQRMIKDGRWPAPLFTSRSHRTKVGVFLRDEAIRMAEVFAEHCETSAHYYATHTDTRDKLFGAVHAERMKTELGRWAMDNVKSG